MKKEIDELIEKNLKLLGESEEQSLLKYDFELQYDNGLETEDSFIQVLEQKGLISIDSYMGERCTLTKKGNDIFKNGGWLKHLDAKREKKLNSAMRETISKVLELKIANMEKEQQQKLTALTIKNLELQNKQLKYKTLFTVIGFALGFITSNWEKILIFLKVITPPETKF